MFAALAARYPELVAPLVQERDLYMAWSLRRSKAVNGARVVVGIVGRGHLRGVHYALRHDSGKLRFSDLVDGANRKSARRAALVKRVLVELAVGGAVCWAWWWAFG
jgi:pheromone shutdown protein TraB